MRGRSCVSHCLTTTYKTAFQFDGTQRSNRLDLPAPAAYAFSSEVSNRLATRASVITNTVSRDYRRGEAWGASSTGVLLLAVYVQAGCGARAEAVGKRSLERLDADRSVRAVGRVRRRRHDPRGPANARVRMGQGFASDLSGATHALSAARRGRRSAAALRVRAQGRSKGEAGRGDAPHGAADTARGSWGRARTGGIRVRSEVARRRTAHAQPYDGVPQVADRGEAVDPHRQPPGVVARRLRAVDLRAADAGAHAAVPQRALRGHGVAVSLAHAPAAPAGADAGGRQEDRAGPAPGDGRPSPASQRGRGRRSRGARVDRADGSHGIPAPQRELVADVRTVRR